MSDTVGVLAKIDNGWLVAAFGRESYKETLDDAIQTIRDGAEAYLKMKEAVEKEATKSVLTPKEFARSIEPRGRR